MPRLHSLADLSSLFGPDAQAQVKKNGASAEAARREVDAMEAIARTRANGNANADRVNSDGLFAVQPNSKAPPIAGMIHNYLAQSRAIADLVTTTLVLSPEDAEYILREHNRDNRSLRSPRASFFANAIREGKWRLTSQGISFSDDGRLNDGQHRLTGVVRAGKAIEIRATFGEPREVFNVLDTHKVRGGADTLHVIGYQNTATLAAAGRLLAIVESGNPWANFTIGNADLEALLEKHPELPKAATVGNRIAKKFRCSTGGATLAFYIIERHSLRAARLSEFADRLIDNAGQGARSPITALRDGLLAKTVDQHLRSAGNRGVAQAASIIKTWNAWVSGRKNNATRWEVGETFPLPL